MNSLSISGMANGQQPTRADAAARTAMPLASQSQVGLASVAASPVQTQDTRLIAAPEAIGGVLRQEPSRANAETVVIAQVAAAASAPIDVQVEEDTDVRANDPDKAPTQIVARETALNMAEAAKDEAVAASTAAGDPFAAAQGR